MLWREWHDYDIARTYAPILRFASPERFFPTIPFFTAFDLRDPAIVRMSDTLAWAAGRGPRPGVLDTLARVLEVDTLAPEPLDTILMGHLTHHRARIRLREPMPSFGFLKRRYQVDRGDVPSSTTTSLPAVFYRVCDVRESRPEPAQYSDAEKIWQYLRSDEQAWHRYGMDTVAVPDSTSMIVIQYFFYYVQDAGLQGHSDDLESVFVFTPRDSAKAKRLRIIVGAGHKDPAPNNVLVMFDPEPKYDNTNVLVEYGGHSSAPDVLPLGQFSVGLDVNWHIDDVWGTRDPQASAGIAFHGRYDATMTYPRDPDDALTLFPPYLGKASKEMLESLVRFAPAALGKRVADKLGQNVELTNAVVVNLADAVLTAYEAERVAQHKSALARTGQVAAMSAESGDTVRLETLDAMGVGRIEGDSAASAAVTEAVSAGGDSVEQSRGIRSVLATVELKAEEGSAIADSLTGLLRQRSASITSAALKAELVRRLRLVVKTPTPLDAAVRHMQSLTDERLKPTYALIPAIHLERIYRGLERYVKGQDSHGARDEVTRDLMLVTRLLTDVPCLSEDLACGLYRLQGEQYDSAVRLMCETYPRSLACRLRGADSATADPERADALLRLMARWNDDLWDAYIGAPRESHQLSAKKHKIWEHELYRDPTRIFRTHLFRPTWVQSKRSWRDAQHLLAAGLNGFFGDRAVLPYVGFIIPAFQNIPVRIPGYLEVQVGPYMGWSGGPPMGSIALLYDTKYANFLGGFVKGLWVNHRAAADRRPDASSFTLSAGVSAWCPCVRPLHLRSGVRADMNRFRPSLGRLSWDLQVEARF